MKRPATFVLLLGGWLLLTRPDGVEMTEPLAAWKKVRDYDTAWLCEQGRRAEVTRYAQHAAKERTTQGLALDAGQDRFRCERVERVAPLRRPTGS